MAKKHPPGGECLSHSPVDEGQLPFESNVGAFGEESAAGSPAALNRPASCEPCPGAARMSAPLPGCSSPPPLPPGEPADIRPLWTSVAPSMGRLQPCERRQAVRFATAKCQRLPTRTVHFSMVRKAVIRHKIKSPRRPGEGFCGTLSAIGLAGLSSHGRFHCRTGRGLITLRE